MRQILEPDSGQFVLRDEEPLIRQIAPVLGDPARLQMPKFRRCFRNRFLGFSNEQDGIARPQNWCPAQAEDCAGPAAPR